MKSDTSKRILSETSEETKNKVREKANELVLSGKLIKNIHLLPSSNQSNLYLGNLGKPVTIKFASAKVENPLNIYITNDEKIKEGDWMLDTIQTGLQPIELATKESIFLLNTPEQGWKKIILTDNTDLIKDGVQAIPDYFLEWFVKNPSCERVEIDHERVLWENGRITHYTYRVIIPKQETLEEVAERFRQTEGNYDIITKIAFEEGAKWQQQQNKNLYSEEDLEQAHFEGKLKKQSFKEWFEQFKKQ